MIEKSIAREIRDLEKIETLQMIISALGKSCEQDVVRALSPMCPRCRALVWDNQRYCFMCGQKLRWSE